MVVPLMEKPTMTDDEIVLWLITKATMEDKPVMRLAADRIIQMAQALREHDDDDEDHDHKGRDDGARGSDDDEREHEDDD